MNQCKSYAPAKTNDRSAEAGEETFFNLHCSGIGYLNRVRLVDGGKRKGGSSRRGDSFLCCAINALHGSVDDPNYSYFDLKVAGGEATEIVEMLREHVEADRKVLVAFKVGDIYAHSYERKVRDQQGRPTDRTEWASLIKGRLLLITMAKVEGAIVYQREEEGAAGGAAPQQAGSPNETDELLDDDEAASQEAAHREDQQARRASFQRSEPSRHSANARPH